MIKVLFVAGEAAPFIKTGGLGNVVASLPKELRLQGIDARVIIPKYGAIAERFRNNMTVKASFHVPLSWRLQPCGLEELEYDGIPYYFIDNEYYFKRSGIYGHYDDAERYAFFSRAVLEALPHMGFQPHILHCHDWHSSMVSVFLTAHYQSDPFYEKIRTLLTIHNLKYQGVFPKDIMINLLDLGWEYFTANGLEFYDKVNFLKGGLIFSDLINTVSPTYAQEIQNSYFGEKLEGVLSSRASDLSGIINGIDYTTYNPATDPSVFVNYDWQTRERKIKNKVELQRMLGLAVGPDRPLLAMNCRLVEAKGIDLVLRVIDELLDTGAQIVIVGQGEEHYHRLLWQAAWLHNDRLAAIIPYSEDMTRKVYAAADLFLMPSRYEPCGIAQLIAMRYGCLPVVRETGGLNDTVRSYNEDTGEGNGFSFANYNAHDFLYTVRRAIHFYHNKEVWNKLTNRVMRADNSWHISAGKYRKLYHKLYVEEYIYKEATSQPEAKPRHANPHSIDPLIPVREAPYAH
ncbi:glycogen synthase GlgA [Sporomusa sp.]|uniref:glycogen synthase GlgA n=1 Tax=Sporomusa sp. TaxID=2078658 RepID=UPI002D0C2E0B|nr:glycogen synthase GlgA [Sporomusa sp.]HWR09553.1 glycogen synthase GlgA [Sporomusa sp.]